MPKIRLTVMEKDVPIEEVSCGVASIDTMQKDAFCRTLYKQALAYNIVSEADNRVVGSCMIRLVRICDENQDYYVGNPEYIALEISYIAINKKDQGRRFGAGALASLILQAKKLSKTLPIRFLIIDAFNDKEKWYVSSGFRKYPKKEDLRYPGTVPMRMDLIDIEAAKRYTELHC